MWLWVLLVCFVVLGLMILPQVFVGNWLGDAVKKGIDRSLHAQSPASLIAPARVRIMASIPAIALAIAADLTLHASELQTNEPELALPETKDAPRTMARGASDSVSQRNANSVDPSVPPESATSGRPGQGEKY